MNYFENSYHADSSIIEPKTYENVIKIKVKRLSDYIDRPIKLLKLEAEGAEPDILIGLRGKLNKIKYISSDLGFDHGIKAESILIPALNSWYKNNF